MRYRLPRCKPYQEKPNGIKKLDEGKECSAHNVPPQFNNEEVPAIVFDDSCINVTQYDTALMGEVNDFTSLSNLKKVLTVEGFESIKIKYMGGFWVMMEFDTKTIKEKFKTNVGIGTWFTQIIQATNDFSINERVMWIDIEGIPLKGELLYCDEQEEGYLHSKRICVSKEDAFEENVNLDGTSDIEEVAETIFEKEQTCTNRKENGDDIQKGASSEDPFDIYDLLNKKKEGNRNVDKNSEDSLQYPPGFTPVIPDAHNVSPSDREGK
nr:nucleotide-binding alpha-beta plait domain-containing protein [Tanacetum cinerariifolium]